MTRVQRSAPEPVWDLGGLLLEGPVWVAREQALWFVDIKSRRIHRYDPATGARASFETPAQVGFCLPTSCGRFVAGLQTGLSLFEPEFVRFTPLVDPEPHLPGNRLNDGTVDPGGRLWFGTMDDGERDATGRIWRLGADGACVAATAPVAISNGPVVSADARTLYHVDTGGSTIHVATLGEDGSLADGRVFARIPKGEGYPDGPILDAEGCLWIGLYMGHGARRYAPSGELLEEVRFPVSAVTKLAFGGSEGRTLYATTASKHLDAAGRAAEPLAGALFAFEVDVPGAAVHDISLPRSLAAKVG